MIGIACKVTRSGEVIHDQTTFFEGQEIKAIGKKMQINDEPLEITFSFDPPLITEIPLQSDEAPA